MNQIPCKDCIVFALCNSRVKRLNGVYKTQFIIRDLEKVRCSLFHDWLYQTSTNAYSYEVPVVQMKEFAAFYKIKYDIDPDTNLLRPKDYHFP